MVRVIRVIRVIRTIRMIRVIGMNGVIRMIGMIGSPTLIGPVWGGACRPLRPVAQPAAVARKVRPERAVARRYDIGGRHHAAASQVAAAHADVAAPAVVQRALGHPGDESL